MSSKKFYYDFSRMWLDLVALTQVENLHTTRKQLKKYNAKNGDNFSNDNLSCFCAICKWKRNENKPGKWEQNNCSVDPTSVVPPSEQTGHYRVHSEPGTTLAG